MYSARVGIVSLICMPRTECAVTIPGVVAVPAFLSALADAGMLHTLSRLPSFATLACIAYHVAVIRVVSVTWLRVELSHYQTHNT